MKLKKVGAICNAEGRYYLYDVRDKDGETVRQWLGDGSTAYPLAGLPYMEMGNVCAMYDLTEKKQDKCFMRHDEAPKGMNWEDADFGERQLEEPKLCVRYEGRDMLPLRTSEGITFIQGKYLAPLDNLEYMQLFERRTEGGGVYIVAKIGLLVQAVIMPTNIVNDDFMDRLDDLADQCRVVLRKKQDLSREREYAEFREQGTLFRVDDSTGEVLNFPDAKRGADEE